MAAQYTTVILAFDKLVFATASGHIKLSYSVLHVILLKLKLCHYHSFIYDIVADMHFFTSLTLVSCWYLFTFNPHWVTLKFSDEHVITRSVNVLPRSERFYFTAFDNANTFPDPLFTHVSISNLPSSCFLHYLQRMCFIQHLFITRNMLY